MKEDIIFLLKQLWDTHVNECWEVPEYVYEMMIKYDITLADIGVKEVVE